jgi:hypothetical protein
MGGNIVYSIFYLNPILTPDQSEYKRYYSEEREYGYIGSSFGSSVILQLAEYNVTNNQSIWPYAD